MKEMSVQREQMAEIWEDGRNILLIIRTMTHVSMQLTCDVLFDECLLASFDNDSWEKRIQSLLASP